VIKKGCQIDEEAEKRIYLKKFDDRDQKAASFCIMHSVDFVYHLS
jgi:hypothetical protein